MGGEKSKNVFFLVKKWTFPQRSLHYVQYQYFFCFAFYLLRGVYAPNTPPTGLNTQMVIASASELCQLSCQHDQACFVCCGVCKIK